jgi:type IV pilus assembly protein PilM
VFPRKRSAPAVVGLDLDPGHIAAALVKGPADLTVTRSAVAPLAPGVLRDGEVTDPAGLAEALRAFFAEHDLPPRVRVGVANQRIVVRTLDVAPVADPRALDAAVRATAPDHIPMPMEEAVLDFQPLGPVETAEGPRTRVAVVAVRREMVERLAAATTEAGLRLEGIDLSAFAFIRALARPEAEGAVLYVNAAGLANVAVAHGTACLFTRAAAGGFERLVLTLAERRSLTLEHSRQWLGHVGLAAPLATLEGDPELVAATRGVLEEGVHGLADTVRNSLNFYRMQDGAQPVEQAILTGPAVAIPGFAEALGEQLRLPVAPVAVEVDGSGEAGEGETSRLTVAAGLAVEERR